jgi:hypothetical protein
MDKIIFKFKVLYSGWECDEDGYVKERKDGSRYLELTNHGRPYEAKLFEVTNKIAEYEKAIKQTQKAVNLFLEKR